MGTDTQVKFSTTVQITLDDFAGSGVYGQLSPINTVMAQLPGVYGQVSALSGFDQFSANPSSNINGIGDIIYYGDVADIKVDSGEFSATFDNQVMMSGMAMPISSYQSLTTQESNSIIFSANGVSILPSADEGVYFFFSNHDGLVFSVSGVDSITISGGTSNLVSVSGVGSHLGLIGTGSEWIAIEEEGVL